MGSRVNYSGLVIAGIGFFLTRFTVTLAIYDSPARFYLAGVVPLVLGLGLAAFGVAMTVADVESSLVRTTAVWCVVGAATMLVLVVLTLLGSSAGGMPGFETVRSRTYLSNFLIGGSVGGTFTGLYAARNRRQRGELHHQANRLDVLNRLLRHEVLNALTAIRGYAAFRNDDTSDAQAIIEARSDGIEETIEEVKYLTRTARTETTVGSIDVASCIQASVDIVRERHPEAEVSVETLPEDLAVRANQRLEHALVHLIENAVVHDTSDTPTVTVSVTETAGSVRISVTDDGPGLPESERALLETGDIDHFDNPGSGFGLNIVRFLVESYRGSIETTVDDGTTVTVVLSRDDDDAAIRSNPASLTGVRPAIPHLLVTLGAALVAGVSYGVVVELAGGRVGIIGALYGVMNPGTESTVVGWITHEFHSVVFGFVFAGLVSLAPRRYRHHLPAYVVIGLGWAVVLWFFAAGIVSPVWLRLLDIPAPVPSLRPTSLASHLAWGFSMGVLTALGYRHLTPSIARIIDRLRGLRRR
jgi:two-component system OmpR family sensor kinase